MKKSLIFVFIFIAINTLSVGAAEVNIVNSVQEEEYTYSIEHVNSNDKRVTVSTGFEIDDQLKLDSSPLQKSTNLFFVRRTAGNKELDQDVIVEIKAENFTDYYGVVQDFYPTVKLYKDNSDFSYSVPTIIANSSNRKNGMEFGLNVPAGIHDVSADIGAFYLYYDYELFTDLNIIAGQYVSNIEINITTDM